MSRRGRTLAVVAGAVALASGGLGLHTAGAATSQVASVVVPVTPFRILDTRLGIGTGGVVAPVGPGQTVTLQVAGVGTVPANATGVILNVTVNGGTRAGYVTVWPTGEPRPEASVLNITPGQDLPNMITAALGDGKLDLFNFTGSVHLIADVAAYLVPGGGSASPGPRGLSAWDTLPSGLTVTGAETYHATSGTSTQGGQITVQLPGVAPVALTDANVNFSPDIYSQSTDDDATCTGSASNPTAPPGKVCIYAIVMGYVDNVYGQSSYRSKQGFQVRFHQSGPSPDKDLDLNFVWAYTAP